MNSSERFVATTTGETRQTFVFDGDITLSEMFAKVAERERGGTLADHASRLCGDSKVFFLTISRDESSELTSRERFHDRMERVASPGREN